MPVVFVHGVATRRSAAYERAALRRAALWEAFLAPAWGVPPGGLGIVDAYWGDAAARFGWNHASLPGAGEERFGTADPDTMQDLLGFLPARGGEVGAAPLTALARESLAAAVDLLWEAAGQSDSGAQAPELARLAAEAADYAERQPQPAWLAQVRDDRDFLAALLAHLVEGRDTAPEHAGPAAVEAFGPSRRRAAVGRLREGLARIASAVPRAATTATLSVARSRTHRSVSVFLGDVLAYLRQREQHGADGAIARAVAGAVEEGARSRTEADPRLVVVAHSMGGNIVYDLLSHLRPDLECDALVTVGSQVGLFAELDLFPAVAPPLDPAVERVPALAGVGRWINVFDPDDVLAFVTAGIFAGAEDYRYSTGRGLLGAHSGYLLTPSFHHLLAGRLGNGPAAHRVVAPAPLHPAAPAAEHEA
ncbi:hypothetical protein [Streptomyces sp. NBC_01198]|uniref:hypothetical protein n=1 Tax=Streptomyces sp. NBC_01198 TaxID=2903769 RepID=UPI002E0DE463|nr:hypothetical protein OG702_00675 [Streptomyces sp. NBC_01198]